MKVSHNPNLSVYSNMVSKKLQIFSLSMQLKDISTPDLVEKSRVEKFLVEKSRVEKFMVEKSRVEKFMVEKSEVERSGVEAWV